MFKSKSILDLLDRKSEASEKHIRKHKGDIFRMAALLTSESKFELPNSIKTDMQSFADIIKNELPDKQMFKDLGIPNIDVDVLFKQYLSNFKLERKQ